jgi:hypothetical protein
MGGAERLYGLSVTSLAYRIGLAKSLFARGGTMRIMTIDAFQPAVGGLEAL